MTFLARPWGNSPQTYLGMILACSLTQATAVAADGPWLLPPGASAGTETAQGAIPVAAALQEVGQVQRDPGFLAAGNAFFNLGTAYKNEKGGGFSRNTYLSFVIGGVQELTHIETADTTGLLVGANALDTAGWGGTDLLKPLFANPGLRIAAPSIPGGFKVNSLRVRGAATETTPAFAQGLAYFEILPSMPFKAGQKPLTTLAVRIRYLPDGWARIQLRLGDHFTFEQSGVAPLYSRQATDGRTEHLSLSGSEVPPAPLGAWLGGVKADANPGIIWYGTGGLGSHMATFALFDPKQIKDMRTGQFGNNLNLVQWKTNDNQLDLLFRTSQSFTAAEQASFIADVPTLYKRLTEPFPPLSKAATTLYLPPVRRSFIEHMLADAPALIATPKPGKKKKPDMLFMPGVVERAAQRLGESLESYDRLLAVLLAAKPGPDTQVAEEDALTARTFLDDAFAGMAKYWADAGGIER